MSFVGSRWADVGVAWSHQSVRRGFYGTFLIALGSLTPAYLPRNSPWLRLLGALHATGTPFKVLGTVLVLAGMAILVDAWFRMRPSDIPSQAGSMVYHDVRHWAVLVIWGAPFVFAPPIFSHDAYSYAARGGSSTTASIPTARARASSRVRSPTRSRGCGGSPPRPTDRSACRSSTVSSI